MKDVKRVLVIFLMNIFLSLSSKVPKNEIVKVLHHKGIDQLYINKKDKHLYVDKAGKPLFEKNMELGNVIFYFSGKPIVNFVPERKKSKLNNKKQDNLITKVFIFPYAHIKDARMVNFINDDRHNKNYSLRIEKINLPIKGVKFSLTYNPNNIVFDYNFFDSISNFKGVVFNIYNKRLRDRLQVIEDTILRTVLGTTFLLIQPGTVT